MSAGGAAHCGAGEASEAVGRSSNACKDADFPCGSAFHLLKNSSSFQDVVTSLKLRLGSLLGKVVGHCGGKVTHEVLKEGVAFLSAC